MKDVKLELKQIKIQVRLGIEQKEIKQQYGILLLDSIEKAINYTHCCKSDSEPLVCDTCKNKRMIVYWHETGMGAKRCEDCNTN